MTKKKCVLLRKLIQREREINKFMDSLPSEISQVFYDNPAHEGLWFQVQDMIKAHFKDEAETVNHILYEDLDRPVKFWEADGQEYNFATVEDYVDWLEANP